MNNQGLRYWKDGRYDLAEQTLQQALQQAQQDLGPNHYGVGITLVNIGLVYTDEGKYAEAVEVYQRADPILERKYGAKNPTYAQFLNNYGYAYLRYGKYTQAREKYEQSLSIYGAVGKSEADTANVTNGLSMTYRGTGDIERAETIAKRALGYVETDESRWGYKGPILQNLGTIYTQQGRYDRAEEAYTQVLIRREMKMGTSHPETGRTVASLAVLYVKEGKEEQAESHFKRAIDIFERKLPPEHPDTVELIAQYADFLRSVGRNNEALELEQRTHTQ
jgi:tetratricopeptide (TPR) repeat protein